MKNLNLSFLGDCLVILNTLYKLNDSKSIKFAQFSSYNIMTILK